MTAGLYWPSGGGDLTKTLVAMDTRLAALEAAEAAEVAAPEGCLAYAENTTAVILTTASAANHDIPGCTITVEPGPLPIHLEGRATIYQPIVGAGLGWLIISEMVAGVSTSRWWSLCAFPNVLNSYLGMPPVERNLGIVTAPRTFKLAIKRTVTAGAEIGAVNNEGGPSVLMAVAR